MNQLGATRDVPAGSGFRSDGTAPSSPEQRALADPSNVLTIIGTVTSQGLLITALLYYFGWVRAHSFLGYFGVDPSLVGYSTTDYVLRSINVAFPPFIRAAFAALVLFGFHRLVMAPALMNITSGPPPPSKTAISEGSSPITPRVTRRGLSRAVGSVVHRARAFGRWRLGPSGIQWFIGAFQAVAISLSAAVLTGVLFPEQIGAPLGLLLPLLLIVSVTLLGYVAHLRSRYPDALAATKPPRSALPPNPRAYTLTLLALGLVAGLWAVSLYGDNVGTRLATDMVAQYGSRTS